MDVKEVGYEPVTGWWRHDIETSGSIKGKEYQTGRILAS
jgi:hypothetical protein